MQSNLDGLSTQELNSARLSILSSRCLSDGPASNNHEARPAVENWLYTTSCSNCSIADIIFHTIASGWSIPV
uniref:Uncharacterized protein n=1 Tax=Rhizophora mucronata TaxID=61149 RepID=A0A2P2PPD2_RHIMU